MFSGWINNYFGFTKQQRKGLLMLLLFSFALLIIRLTYPAFIQPDPIQLAQLRFEELPADTLRGTKIAVSQEEGASNEEQLRAFDPNTVQYEQLLALGFTSKTAKTFLKFRNKGFVFKRKEDVQKIYGLSPDLYAKIEPYITLSPKKESDKSKLPQPAAQASSSKSHAQSAAKLEMNTADSLALLSLRGIGPSFAKRILKYRSMLGGFYQLDQLKEVYGFGAEKFDEIKPFVWVNPEKINKIHLNTDDFKSINKHPYISFEHTKSLVNLRRKTTLDAALVAGILNNDTLYRKLLPYLAFD
jgi:competence protein ComEA